MFGFIVILILVGIGVLFFTRGKANFERPLLKVKEEKDIKQCFVLLQAWIDTNDESVKSQVVDFCNQKLAYYVEFKTKKPQYSFLGERFYNLIIDFVTSKVADLAKLKEIYEEDKKINVDRIGLSYQGTSPRSEQCFLVAHFAHLKGEDYTEVVFTLKGIFDQELDLAIFKEQSVSDFPKLIEKNNAVVELAQKVISDLKQDEAKNAEKLVSLYFLLAKMAGWDFISNLSPDVRTDYYKQAERLFINHIIPRNTSYIYSCFPLVVADTFSLDYNNVYDHTLKVSTKRCEASRRSLQKTIKKQNISFIEVHM